MKEDKFIDIESLALLINTERRFFNNVEADFALADHQWKLADIAWFKANKRRKCLLRAVMKDEVSPRHMTLIKEVPSHALIYKVNSTARAKFFLTLDKTDRCLTYGNKRLSVMFAKMFCDEMPHFIDVDAITEEVQ